MNSSSAKQDLETLSTARILFGHKSVGQNVIEGLQDLSAELGVSIRILPVNGVPPDDAPGFFHSEIGDNGDPDGKCERFSQLLTRPEKPAYDLAMMKFCYVDLGRGTPLEVSAMLRRYSSMIEQLAAERPDVKIVHATLPLRSDPDNWKTPVKRMIGSATWEDEDNILRNTFNEALRERYGQQPLWDIARVESTYPGGKRSSFEEGGRTVYTLAQTYTYDGGHLNEDGRRRAALELVRVLADALRTAPPSVSAR